MGIQNNNQNQVPPNMNNSPMNQEMNYPENRTWNQTMAYNQYEQMPGQFMQSGTPMGSQYFQSQRPPSNQMPNMQNIQGKPAQMHMQQGPPQMQSYPPQHDNPGSNQPPSQ